VAGVRARQGSARNRSVCAQADRFRRRGASTTPACVSALFSPQRETRYRTIGLARNLLLHPVTRGTSRSITRRTNMPANTINLRLINESNDRNNSEIVIFKKHVATSFDELAVAWKVIQNLGTGNYHPFTYSFNMEVSASDSFGNFTPHLAASPGVLFSMNKDQSGDVLGIAGRSTSPEEVQVLNALDTGAINASIFRDGKLLAIKTGIAPQQKAVFKFKPTLFIGVASQVQEGEILDSAIISSVNTELSLLGVSSADIVMSGGGPGASSTPFRFTLRNVKFM
jgi:hypothetical protein